MFSSAPGPKRSLLQKGKAAGKMSPWLRAVRTQAEGPQCGPSPHVRSWASKEVLKAQLKGGERQDGHWGLLASSLVDKMPALG